MCNEGIQQRVRSALANLRANDLFLFQNNLHERTLCHKFAEYLQQEFPEYRVDCEYNREGEKPKRVDWQGDPDRTLDAEGHADSIFPHIIIHERGTNNQNILVIEVKKANNRKGAGDDIKKIRACVEQELQYQCGLLLIFNTELADGEHEIVAHQEWFFRT